MKKKKNPAAVALAKRLKEKYGAGYHKRIGKLGGRRSNLPSCTKYPSHRFSPKGICYGCKINRSTGETKENTKIP